MWTDQRWRARLTRDIAWSLLIKLGALALMWALFFSSSHRCRVDGAVAASRFALDAGPTESYRQPDRTRGGERCD
jgi:hypothetical protein